MAGINDGIDDIMRRSEGIIDRVGWAVVYVLPTTDDPDGPSSATPFGLTAHDYPELLTAGLPAHFGHALLNDMATRVYDQAQRFHHGRRITDLLAGHDATIIDATITDELLPGAALARYGHDQVRLQQLVWPDPDGHFPWDERYTLRPQTQPVLGRP